MVKKPEIVRRMVDNNPNFHNITHAEAEEMLRSDEYEVCPVPWGPPVFFFHPSGSGPFSLSACARLFLSRALGFLSALLPVR